MSFVATLVCRPTVPKLDATILARAGAALEVGDAVRVLSPGAAVEFDFDTLPANVADERLRSELGAFPIDVFVQSNAHRRKRLLIADMDSTMIRQECIDELAAELGLKDRISAITERAMRGEIAFEPALRERVALLRGLTAQSIETVLSNRIQLMPGGRTLVQTMKANGAYCALVSGGFTRFTKPISAMIGFDEHQANVLEEENGELTGTVREPILGRDAKRERLDQLIAEKTIDREHTLAVGDGANDLAMLEAAGLGVAYRAKPAVAAAADARIDHGDLTALLFLQGYREDEFILS